MTHILSTTATAALSLFLSFIPTPSPAYAQSIYPNLAGLRFCSLRQSGVEYSTALEAALTENYSATRPSYPVTLPSGKVVSSDLIEFTRFIARNCPTYLK